MAYTVVKNAPIHTQGKSKWTLYSGTKILYRIIPKQNLIGHIRISL